MKAFSRFIVLFGLALATPLFAAPKKIVFISHLSSHGKGQHEYGAGCQLLGKWLTDAYGEDQVTWEHHIIWPEDPDKTFADAATVVFFCSGGNGHLVNKHVKAFDEVMKRGVGLACLHYGVEVPIGPPGKGMLNWMGGYFEANWSVNPHWIAEFKEFPEHPAAAGLKPFTSNDEWYFHMRFRPEMQGITPILSAHPPAKTMERPDGAHSGNPDVRKSVADGNAQHVAWTYQRGEEYGKGRGFGFTGLHYHKNFIDDSFRKTALNGIAWTAQLTIPEGGVASPTPTEADLAKSIIDTKEKFSKKKDEKKATSDATSLQETHARVVVNLLGDGTIMDVKSKVITLEEVEALCRTRREENAKEDRKTKILIRADRESELEKVKELVTAAKNAGVTDVIFATYSVDK